MPSRQPSYYRRTDGKGMFGSLQEAYDRLDVIIESSYDGIYITDGNAVTIRVNRAYLEISGLQEEEVMGQNMWDLEKAGVIDRSGTLIALSTRKPASLEQTFRSGRKALITSTPVFGDGDRIVMVVTNVRDMTDFYELQEKYEAAEALTQKYYSEIQFVRRQVLDSAELIAADQRLLEVLAMVDRVAAMDATVLLLGETGVGKEQIAKYIYKASPRHGERFLTVNCGAIPPNLIESELFGYEKGAFTGANKEGKLGLFELADKGTVFLDEIGELPLDMQVKLLRVLQEQQVVRVGGSEPVSINVRILAATNRDLEEMVRQKTFREDLYYRLNVVPITIPPLRDRRDDILPFTRAFLDELNKKYNLNKQFTPAALQALLDYDWPGNVRELRNLVERMVIMSRDDLIRPSDLPFRGSWTPGGLPEADLDQPMDLRQEMETLELKAINRAYAKYGNVRQAAASLMMDPSTFVRKRRKYTQRALEEEISQM